MGSDIRFIHAADIHLGSIICVNEEDFVYKNAVYDSFEKICSYAIEYKVDFLIISGDLYDREYQCVKANKFFIECCKRLEKENIYVYAIGGNHDPLGERKELFNLPSNVYLFGYEQISSVEFIKNGKLAAKLYGQSYRSKAEGRKIVDNYNAEEQDIFHIALLHTQLDNSNTNYVPCSLSDLKNKEGFSYWALGHIHKSIILNKIEPWIIYPGIPQGRDIGEEGIGGCVLVNLYNSKDSSVELLPTSSVIWKKAIISIDESGLEINNLTELEEYAAAKLEEYISNYVEEIKKSDTYNGFKINKELISVANSFIVDVQIVGRSQLYYIFNNDENEILENMKTSLNGAFMRKYPEMHIHDIDVDIKRPNLEFQEFIANNNLLNEVKEIIKEIYSNDELRKELLNSVGKVWETKWDNENINPAKIQFDEDKLKDILDKSEELILNSLLERIE